MKQAILENVWEVGNPLVSFSMCRLMFSQWQHFMCLCSMTIFSSISNMTCNFQLHIARTSAWVFSWTPWTLGDMVINLKNIIMCHGLSSWPLCVKLLSGKHTRTHVLICQYWFWWWFGAISNKPSPEPMWNQFYVIIWHHWATMSWTVIKNLLQMNGALHHTLGPVVIISFN